MHTESDGAYNSCNFQYYKQKLSIAMMHTKVAICYYCIQKLSFANVAYKSYRSFNAILRFLTYACLEVQAYNCTAEHVVSLVVNVYVGRKEKKRKWYGLRQSFFMWKFFVLFP